MLKRFAHRLFKQLSLVAVAAALSLTVLAPAQALTEQEQKTLKDLNTYFNAVKTMHGDFIQFGPDGSQSDGKFYMARPGKVRFYYNKPSVLDIVADGKSVSVRDRKLNTQDIWPLGQTPLRFLLSDSIDLQRDTNVTNVLVEEDLVTVTIFDKTKFNSGTLTLIFDAKDYALKQWTVTDQQGYDTSVAVYNVVSNGPTNPELFKIDYLANARQDRN
ncbi:MAG: outer membrane lipoprotein carrier protein LolA [Roseibium sp.]|uniref:outer-membrane lipoprotein carrier protein LolA n=1 Tax=Roseibium sp. TaxID=1936156 RepID=UPI001B0F6274|nr:outer-membrane lipoprotein carrier protein LolA [Roseibium sp.]MBO6509058.1 outer membrane lipoprotein carrier protein LolA [Roseibium sp.]MBO6894064.1 outer membrane lipoprotein carrier protein LolA [Roseibium sp.]MBO6929732.1 outer membrane lipoprotein carrier protein LolA [Roseibium sp.]